MKRLFSNISLLFLFTALLSSCGNDDDTQIQASLDSLKNIIDTVSAADTSLSSATLENILNEYSGKYKTVSVYNTFGKSGTQESISKLKSSYLLFPVMKNQIALINPGSSTDTVLTYFNSNDAAFVFESVKGNEKINSLNPGMNGIVLFKPGKVSASNKMYLIKTSKEFQHNTRKVTEYYIEGTVIDAFSVKSGDTPLLKKFGLELK